MKNKILAIALATASAGAIAVGVAYAQTISAAGAQVKIAERADNFRLVDQKSKAYELHYYKNSPAVVIIAAKNGSKSIRDAAPAIKALQAEFAAKDVPVFLLNSSPADNRDT